MEIEKIVSTVQSKVGNTDFSAQTIQKACELFPVADGQEPDEAYFTKVATFITGMQGQYNHDFSTKFREAKKNLLTEDTFKDMSAEQITEIKALLDGLKPSTAPQPQESEEVKALREQLKLLTDRLDSSDKAKQRSDLLQKVKAAMKEQKANDEYVLEKTLSNAQFDETKPLDELTKEFLAKYDAEYTACRGEGAPPRQGNPNGGGHGNTWLDQQFEKKKAREGWGKKG